MKESLHATIGHVFSLHFPQLVLLDLILNKIKWHTGMVLVLYSHDGTIGVNELFVGDRNNHCSVKLHYGVSKLIW